MKIKLNKDLLGLKAGRKLSIRDVDGIPTERYWRRRLKDAKHDNCIEVVVESAKKKKVELGKLKKEEVTDE